ncbi:MAG: YeeE/YedE family protein, partial [Sphingobacterium sp.]
ATGILLVQLIKRKKIKDVDNKAIVIADKDKSTTRYIVGGVIFGLGWALAGACPGPMFVLIGAGYFPILIVIGSALIGTWIYGLLKDKLPH